MSVAGDAAALIAAVCAAPAAETPRRQLAAYLSGRGHPLGGFMTRQLDRHAREAATLRPQPAPDPDELDGLAAARRAWIDLAPSLAELSGRGGGVGFELVRGLAGAVRVTWDELREPAWLAAAPVEHLDVLGVVPDDGLARLAALPALRALRSLALVDNRLDDDDAAALAAIAWPHVRWLDLSGNRIGRSGGAALVASTTLPRLVLASFGGNVDSPTEAAHDPAAIGELAVADDVVLERSFADWAETLWRRHGEPAWARVLWRHGRERPHRWNLWDGLDGLDLGGPSMAGGVALGGRLERLRAAGSRWDHANLAASVLEDVDLSGAGFDGVNLAFGAMIGVRAGGLAARAAVFDHARLIDCDFTGADLRDARFAGAVISGCSFRDARLGCDDGQRYVKRTRGARFIGCDFRGADLDGREMFDVELVDCRLADLRGTPWRTDGSVVRRADRSAAGDGSEVLAEAALDAVTGVMP